MRVTEKGQVTIPKHIRDKLGIVPGSEVVFVDSNGAVVLRKAPSDAKERVRQQFDAWLERVEGSGDDRVTTDDVMLATRGHRLDDTH